MVNEDTRDRLVKLLHGDPNPGVRSTTAQQLSRFYESDGTIANALLEQLRNDDDGDIRRLIVQLLGRWCATHDSVADAFVRVAESDPDDPVRVTALDSLNTNRPGDEKTVRAAAACVSARYAELKYKAVDIVAAAAPDSVDARKALMGELLNPDNNIRKKVLQTIGTLIEAGADDVRSQLSGALDSSNPEIRQIAAQLLGSTLDAEPAAPADGESAIVEAVEEGTTETDASLQIISSGADHSRAHELLDHLLSRLNTLEDSGELDAY